MSVNKKTGKAFALKWVLSVMSCMLLLLCFTVKISVCQNQKERVKFTVNLMPFAIAELEVRWRFEDRSDGTSAIVHSESDGAIHHL